jgi:predicted GNAT superfamily acetyltransferase
VNPPQNNWTLHILDAPDEMMLVEDLQRQVWPGSETDVIPLHILVTAVHNGGLVVGGFSGGAGSSTEEAGGEEAGLSEAGLGEAGPEKGALIGFVFGFPGLYFTPDGARPKHCSHELGVHPAYRDQGLGFTLKRAQWQMIRRQGLDLITWTYDPLLSRNAHLNIARLGAVCNTYLRELYGEMRDGLNAGLPSDRFQLDWWVNSRRVDRRLSKRARPPLDLAHCLSAGAWIVNPTRVAGGWPRPPEQLPAHLEVLSGHKQAGESNLLLVEIPADFPALKDADPGLALEWRLHTRLLFESLFSQGYLVTDFVHLPGTQPRSFYVLTHGESTLQAISKMTDRRIGEE